MKIICCSLLIISPFLLTQCFMLSALLPFTKYHTPFTQKFQGNLNATDIFMSGKMIATTPYTFRYVIQLF